MPVTADARTLRGLYAVLMTRVDVLADRLVAALDAEEHGYRATGSVPPEELHRSCRDNILAVLQILGDAIPSGMDVLEAPRAAGRRRARQRLPLDAVLDSFRIGGRVIWQDLAGEARSCGPAATDAVLDAATSVWEVVDRVSSEVAEAYRVTELEIHRADSAHTRAVMEGLLAGLGHEPGFAAEAARALGLPAVGRFVVVVAAEADGNEAALPGFRAALAANGLSSAWHSWPDQFVGIVALGEHAIVAAQEVLRAQSGVRVGVSAVVAGLAEVQQGHLQAGAALATLPLGSTGTVLLEDALPAAILIAQPELGLRLVQVVLGDVLALAEPDRDLVLETIRAWLAADGSPSATAAMLYCHRNTVLNRLRRIETLIGRTVESTTTRVELALALTALDVLPWQRPAQHRTPLGTGPLRGAQAPSSDTRSSAAR